MNTDALARVTVDTVVLAVRGAHLHVLLTKHAGRWGLPSTPKTPEESLAAAARRVAGEIGEPLERAHLEQLAAYGEPGRDPADHVVSVAHLALVPDGRFEHQRDAARWWVVEDLARGEGPPLELDHRRIVDDAVERTRAKLEYTTLATRLLREPFTVGDLYEVYCAVWGGNPGDKANFARKVRRTEGFVIPTGTTTPHRGRGRPAMRYVAGPATALRPPITRSASEP